MDDLWPWENRGSVGYVKAFFASVFAILIAPVSSFTRMRRLDYTPDVLAFAIGCSIFWFAGSLIQSIFDYYVTFNPIASVPNPPLALDGEWYIINSLLQALLMGAGAIGFWKFASFLYYKIASFDMTEPVSFTLCDNTFAYLMAPSIFAIIPWKTGSSMPPGPTIAIVWMFLLWIIVSVRRLNVRLVGAIIGGVLTFVASMILVFVAFYALQFLWTGGYPLTNGSMAIIAPKPSH